MPRFACVSLVLAVASSCAIEDSGGNPFDVQGTTPSPNVTAADDPNGEPEDDEDESSESGDGDGDGNGSDESSTGLDEGDESSSGAAPVGSTTGEPDSDGDADAGNEPGGQPAEGMYSTCAAPSDCVGVTLCVTIVDPMQVPLGGFCTAPGCANAAVDCIAAPGGTATPMCLPLTVNDMPDAACALDCAGGKTCPTGMECLDVTGASICV